MHLRIRGLATQYFAHLFALDDRALDAHSAMRMRVKQSTQVPCRISLTDAVPGQEVLLVNYEHHAVATPYRSRFAIFVREGEQTYDEVDCVPDQLSSRMLSVRAYDGEGMLLAYDLTPGQALASCATRLLEAPSSAYLHVHYAAAGCYAALIERA